MERITILAAIDSEISRLQQVRTFLSGAAVVTKRGPGRPKGYSTAPKRRQLSPEARAKIAAAQRARWAKAKRASK